MTGADKRMGAEMPIEACRRVGADMAIEADTPIEADTLIEADTRVVTDMQVRHIAGGCRYASEAYSEWVQICNRGI